MKTLYVFFFTISFAVQIVSQKNDPKIDSLENVLKVQKNTIEKCNTLNEISKMCYMKNPDLGIKYGNEALKLSTKLNYEEGVALAYLYLGRNISMKGQYDLSLDYYKKSEAIFRKSSSLSCNIGSVYLNRGSIYGNQSKFPEALDQFFIALKNFESCDDDKKNILSANAFQNIGNVYNFTENYDKALVNYDKAIELFSKIPSKKSSEAFNIALKGFVCEKLKKFDQAIKHYEKAESILLTLNEPSDLAFVKNWKGSALLEMKEFDKSIESSSQMLEDIKRLGDQELLASTYQNIGIAYLKKAEKMGDKAQSVEAFANLSRSLAIHKETNNHEGLIKDYRFLSEYFELKNDFEKSLENHKLYTTYNDSVFNFKNKQSLQNLEDRRTIELRNKEIELNKLTLDAQKRQKWVFIIGIGLLAVIGMLLFYQSRNRKKINQKLQNLNKELDNANKNKIRFFGILNHDLRSPVASLVNFLHLKNNSPDLLDESTKQRLDQQTITSAENLLQQMEDLLLWSKSQMERFEPEKKNFPIQDLFDELKTEFVWAKNIDLQFEDSSRIILYSDKEYLKTIFRNLIANAIKVSENQSFAKIICNAKSELGNIVKLSVKDNAGGTAKEKFQALYNEEQNIGIKNGLGLHVIRDLCKAIDAKIEVETGENIGGTEIVIILKNFPK